MTEQELQQGLDALTRAYESGDLEQIEYSQMRSQLDWDFEHGIDLANSFVVDFIISSPESERGE